MTHQEFKDAGFARPPRRAPYTLIEPGPTVLHSPLSQVDLSQPVEDAISGHIKITITSETPLLVGGGEAAERFASSIEDQPNDLPVSIGGKYVIPGSSIKGMIRSVMETACFARLSFVDDFVGYTRDFSDKTWLKEVALTKQDTPTGGWLFRTPAGYFLVPAKYTRPFDFTQLLPMLNLDATIGHTDRLAWHTENLHQRLNRIEVEDLDGLRDASLFGFEENQLARLVVSGPTPDEGQSGSKEKHQEYVFIWDGDTVVEPGPNLDLEAGDNFLKSLNRDPNNQQTDSGPTTNFSALTTAQRVSAFSERHVEELPEIYEQLEDINSYGLPVFWRNRGGKSQTKPDRSPILSLTAFLRVPYRTSLARVIEKTEQDKDPSSLDLVQALLGWVPIVPPKARPADRKPIERSWKSRVKFGFATSNDAKLEERNSPRTWAAGQPKSSFWPFYLSGGTSNDHPIDYDHVDARIAGRKRYPVRGAAKSLPGGGTSSDGRQRTDMESHPKFLEPGATFSSSIRLHNISKIELGAILWALTFGDLSEKSPYRHSLGRAKSFGFGQAKLTIAPKLFEDIPSTAFSDYSGAIDAFKDWVSQQFETPFDQLPTIQQLKAAANPEIGAGLVDLLTFTESNAGSNPEERILKGYGDLKKSAQNSSQSLPSYPVEWE